MLADWVTATPDWEARILAKKPILPILPLDEERADKAERIFRRLKLIDVMGQPTMGQACDDWVFAFVRAVFGARDSVTKRQVIREFFLLIAKKNGKSSIAAGVMLTALILNERSLAEYLILAPTKDIADNSFIPAYGMVKADNALFARYKPSDSTREIVDRLDGSTLAVKSADAEVVGGQKATAVFVDELWLFGKKASAENILSEATGSLASRPEGFVIFASTQSDDPPAGVFKKKLDYHRDVRDGRLVDGSCLPLIYEYPQAMMKSEAWRDRSTWHIPNPSLGKSVDPEWLATELPKKERDGLDSLKLFVAKHFNVQIGVGLGNDRWAGAEYWEAAADPELTLDALLERSEVVVVGIDGGGLDDLLGVAVLGRCKKTRDWLLWNHAWAQTDVLTRRKEIVSRLQDFMAAGTLTLCAEDDPTQDVREVADIVERIRDAGLLPDKAAIGLDPIGIAAMVDELASRNVAGDQLAGIPQGFRLSGAVWGLERKLKDGTLWHAGQDLMAWCVGNAKVEQRGNAVLITKQAAGKAKIDPFSASLNAAMLMSRNPEAKTAPKFQILVL